LAPRPLVIVSRASASMNIGRMCCGASAPPRVEAPRIAARTALTALVTNAVVSGYVSSDGVAWTLAGSTTTMLSNTTTQLGPVVTSHDPGALNTATFDHVEARVPQ